MKVYNSHVIFRYPLILVVILEGLISVEPSEDIIIHESHSNFLTHSILLSTRKGWRSHFFALYVS
jgi:hypothetical protein